jgi:hypothetical protein
MKNLSLIIGLFALLAAPALGCAGSNEEQRNALTHQQNSDEAAKNGQYGRADDEQRKAQEAHHKAVMKAIDEGKPLPAQTKPGDTPPAPPQ